MNTPITSFGKASRSAIRAVALACAGLVLVAPAAQAAGHGFGGFHGGGHFARGGHFGPGFRGGWGPGFVLGGLGLGIGLGLGSYYYGAPYYVTDPNYVVVNPPVVYSDPQPVATPVPSYTPAPSSSTAPEPVIYPRNGQSAAKMQTDHQQCDQWAGSQRGASGDANVYARGLAACMDARGYTVR